MLGMINEKATTPLQLRFNRSYINLYDGTRTANTVQWIPQPEFSYVHSWPQDAQAWKEKLKSAGLNVGVQSGGLLRISLRPSQMVTHEALIRELMHTVITNGAG
jgi:hypothetical protein